MSTTNQTCDGLVYIQKKRHNFGDCVFQIPTRKLHACPDRSKCILYHQYCIQNPLKKEQYAASFDSHDIEYGHRNDCGAFIKIINRKQIEMVVENYRR